MTQPRPMPAANRGPGPAAVGALRLGALRRIGLCFVCAVALLGAPQTALAQNGFGLTGDNRPTSNVQTGGGGAFTPPPQNNFPPPQTVNPNRFQPDPALLMLQGLGQALQQSSMNGSQWPAQRPPRYFAPREGAGSLTASGSSLQRPGTTGLNSAPGYTDGSVYYVGGQPMRYQGGAWVPLSGGASGATSSTGSSKDYDLPGGGSSSANNDPDDQRPADGNYALPKFGASHDELVAPLLPNKLTMKILPATKRDVVSARDEVKRSMQAAVEELRDEIEAKLITPERLVEILAQNGVDETSSTRLVSMVRAAKPRGAESLALQVGIKQADALRLQKQIELRANLAELEADVDQGEVQSSVLRAIKKNLEQVDTDRDLTSLMQRKASDLRAQAEVYELLSIDKWPKKVRTQSLKSNVSRVLKNPNLPLHSAKLIGDDFLMVGTGNVGDFELTGGVLGEVLGFPVSVDAPPLADAPDNLPYDGLVISNPSENNESISFEFREKTYRLAAGRRRRFDLGPEETATVRLMQPGGGVKLYTVKSGYYRLKYDGTWEMVQRRFRAVLDNLDSPVAFNVEVNGQTITILAGGEARLREDYPLQIRFDRGDGQEARTVTTAGQGEIIHAMLDDSDLRWNLYAKVESSDGDSLIQESD